MTALCFVDANVFVYAANPRDASKHLLAKALIDRLWREQSGRTSIQVLNEFYATVTRKLGEPLSREDGWAQVEILMVWNPLALDSQVLNRARQIESQAMISWWDALIVAAAQLQDCALLYTEDLQHGSRFGAVQVRNPFVSEVQEPPPEYRVELVSRHRPRGRPRKAVA